MDAINHSEPTYKAKTILAVVICLCYVFNPVLPGLKGLFHSLSHALEVPDHIITHTAELYGNSEQLHVLQEHVQAKQMHEHEIIEFITSVDGLTGTNKESSGNPTIDKYLDKHLVGTPKLVPDIARGNSLQLFRALSFITMPGFAANSLKPPIG